MFDGEAAAKLRAMFMASPAPPGWQQVTNCVEKAIVEQASHVEAAVGQVNKLQAKAVTQAGCMGDMRKMVRLVSDKLAFAGKIAGEWGKQVLASTRTAAEALTKK